MDNLHWTVQAASAYTQGGNTPASVYATTATRQGDVHQPGLSEHEHLTVDVEGQALPCYALPADAEQGEQIFDAHARSVALASKALAALWNQHEPNLTGTPLVLSVNENDWSTAEAFQERLVDALFAMGEVALAEWCDQTPVYRLDDPEQRKPIEAESTLVWLSADTLINQATVDRLSDRVAVKHFPDGLVLGEAATALWLTTGSVPGGARLTLYSDPLPQLNSNQPMLAEVQPYSQALVTHLDQDMDQQAHWHQWLGDFEPKTEFDLIQHASLSLGFGYVGSAGPGLAVLCALGRSQMPCPPVDTQWIFHQNLDNSYSLMKLETSNNTALTQPQPKTGGLSG